MAAAPVLPLKVRAKKSSEPYAEGPPQRMPHTHAERTGRAEEAEKMEGPEAGEA